MDIIAIDDEKLSLDHLVRTINKAVPNSFISAFCDVKELLDFVSTNKVDIAFIDIEIKGISGIELAKKIKKFKPNVNIIFVTGYSKYSYDAFLIRASGYLLKPVSCKDIENEILNLRNPIKAKEDPTKLKVQTFGNFEVFFNNEPLHFTRSKSKELFAYLVDRKGASVTMAELATILWEDKEYDRSRLNQIHTFLSELMKVLKSIKANHVIIKTRNHIAVNVEAIECDYYKFLQGDVHAINSFTDEYMTNYSWAEFTVGTLYRLSPNSDID